MSLKDELRATRNAADVPLLAVATPEWPSLDGKLFVRVLSAFEVDAFFSVKDTEDGNDRAKFVCKVLCDADHNRVLDADDAVWLGQKEVPVVERIYWAGRLHNGLTEENRQAYLKNSGSAAGGGLVSSSPEPSKPVLT